MWTNRKSYVRCKASTHVGSPHASLLCTRPVQAAALNIPRFALLLLLLLPLRYAGEDDCDD